MQSGDIVRAKVDIVTLYAKESVTEAKAGEEGVIQGKMGNGLWLVKFPHWFTDCDESELEVIRKAATA
jgi:hypothetical protein